MIILKTLGIILIALFSFMLGVICGRTGGDEE